MNTTPTPIDAVTTARMTRLGAVMVATSLCLSTAVPSFGQSIIGYWNFDETTGATANDIVNNNDGTWQNGTNNFAWVAGGQIGRAVDLQGNNDNGANFFNVGTISQFTGATQMTFSTWIQPDSQSDTGYNGIFASRVENWGIAYEGNNHTDNRTANNATGGSNGSPDSTNIVLPNGNWYHAAMTFDTVTGAKRVYINGNLNASGTSTGFVPTAAAQFAIGMDGPTGSSNRDFDGRIDDLSLWNGALSGDRVDRIYQGGLNGQGANNVNTFTFNIPGNGNWGDASTWDLAADYPNMAGDVALLVRDHGTQDRILTLNVSDANAHRIVFDDPGTNPDRGWIINPTAGQSITMTVSAAKRGHLESYNHATNVVNAPIVITGDYNEAYTLIDPNSTLHLAEGFTYTTPADGKLRARLDGKLILGGTSEAHTLSVREVDSRKAALNVDLDGGKLTLNRLHVNGANTGRGLFEVKNGGELIIAGSGSQFFVGGGDWADLSSPSGGAHTLTLTDGTITSDTSLVLVHNGGDATAQLNGGTLTVRQIQKGTGSGLARLQLNGVTLKPTGDHADFLTSDLTARIWNGGVVFDTSGFDITVNSFLGNQSGATTSTLEKTGAGTLTLTDTGNNYRGDTIITEGTLKVGASNLGPGLVGPIPFGANVGDVVVNGTLDINNFETGINGLSGSGTIINSGADARNIRPGFNNATSTFDGDIIGNTLSVLKQGSGEVTLNGTVNVNGVWAREGTLTFGAGSALTTGNAISVNSGGEVGDPTLKITGGTHDVNNWIFVGNSTSSNTSGHYVQTGGTMNLDNLSVGQRDSGNLNTADVSGGILNVNRFYIGNGGDGRLTVSGGADINVAGGNFVIGNVGDGQLVMSGGTLTGQVGLLIAAGSGSNSHVDLNGGILEVPQVARGSGNGEFFFNGGTLRATASSSTFMQGLTNAYVRGGDAKIDTNGFDITIAQDLLLNPGSSDAGLAKNGAGLLRLTGTSTYDGQTDINAGELRVDGDISASSGVNVGAGTRLSGTGVVSGIGGAGLVSPGTSPGILTSTGSLDPSGGLDFAFEFSAPGTPDYTMPTASINDVLVLTDPVPFDSPLDSDNTLSFYFDLETISDLTEFRGGFFEENESFDMLSAVENADLEFFVRGDGGGLVEFNGTNYYPLAEFDPSLGFNLSTALENGGRVLQLTSTPEPASLLMWLGLGIVLFFVRRRYFAKNA